MSKKIDALGISAFCESMAMMLQAGIQTDEAVELLLEDQEAEGKLTDALKQVQSNMNEGHSFAESAGMVDAFPAYAVSMMKAGEDGGRLEPVLFELSEYYSDQHTIQSGIRGAITYPVVMLILIIAVLGVMLAAVLPVFTDVYNRMTGSLTSSSYSYIRWAYGLCIAAFVIMIVIAILLVVGVVLWRSQKFHKSTRHMLEKMPATAGIMRSMGLTRFFSALSMYLSGGYMQDTAVEESREMIQCGTVEDTIGKCLTRMEQGEGFAQAAYQEHLLEPVYGRMMLAGSRSGNLDDVLAKLKKLQRDDVLERVSQLVAVVDPILSGVMMLTVGFSLISVMLPLIGMMTSIG